MATFIFDGGVNETEPTLIADSQVQGCSGAEYRVGQRSIYAARGRDSYFTVSSATGKGLYEASFDASAGFVVAHEGDNLHSAPVSATPSTTLIDTLPTGSSAIVGAHYANRHYVATGVANRRLESSAGGITSFPIGMSTSTFTIGVSVTQGSGSISATVGLEYWCTEYDSSRGIESILGSTANTGIFTSKDSVIVTVTGTSANSRADQIRWYKSVDGGGYPDGGLIQTTAIGTTQITDDSAVTGTLTVPQYGIVSIGGLDTNRDEAPPVLTTLFGPYQDSLLGVDIDEPRVLRFTPAGFADSWPGGYGIPIETSRNDEIVTGVVLSGRIGVFCKDSVHVVYRLPRDSDSVFAAGEAQDEITLERGCVSRRGACVFTPPGSSAFSAFVSRDGIWISRLIAEIAPIPVTDHIRWESHVSIPDLKNCRLLDDPINRRLIFIHRRTSDTTHNTGLWYLDYQRFSDLGIRITFANHGPLADAATIEYTDSQRRVVSIDSRVSNGSVYVEAIQDVDDSQLVNSDGAVAFRMRTKEYLPAGPTRTARMGDATWLHDAGPARINHRFYYDRRDSNPEKKTVPKPGSRNAGIVGLQRDVNSLSLEIESTGTISYGIHWVDIEGYPGGELGGRGGA